MFQELLQLLLPERCVCCQSILISTQKYICYDCESNLPYRNNTLCDNRAKQLIETFCSIDEFYSLLYFNNNIYTKDIIHSLKYGNQPKLGNYLGEKMGMQLTHQAIFDWIIPIPLHPIKEKKRGYNQALQIAEGISKQIKVPIDNTSLLRTKNNQQQAKIKSYETRFKNVHNIFSLKDSTKHLMGKKILLIDDVVTSGATVFQAALPLLIECNCTLSIGCISFAH